ncbi:MAG: hypothetical protein LQ339_008537 [Xanthoria mediterranea]|nr:MAG: hypothetical protein LQ339_008537 [Xanthoria mediterranea]
MSSSPPTTTNSKPTILLIHGAWHTPATWDALRSALHSASYPTLAPALPSSGSLVSSHHDDIGIIRHELERLILSESKQVVLVCHSYGGMVGSGAVAGLEAYRRKAEKKEGGVVHCLFLCAFLVPIGKTVADMEDERPWWHHIDPTTPHFIHPLTPHQIFYNDIDPTLSNPWIARLQPLCKAILTSKATAMLWDEGRVPCTHMICTEDHAIRVAVQERMVEDVRKGCEERGVGTGWLKVVRVECGHSPWLGEVERVVQLVREGVREGAGEGVVG